MATHVCFSEEELALLARILQDSVEDAHTDIRRTDNVDYKQWLRQRLEVIERMVSKIRDAGVSIPAAV